METHSHTVCSHTLIICRVTQLIQAVLILIEIGKT
ncbi:hypothetical protein J3D56_000045 [Erwinia persicina]|nr:hypothetical protein [Erwinia persicina]